MAASILAALLAQNQPTVDGNQALIVFGLQNDFVGPNPKLPLPMESGWFDHIKELVPKFREFAGDIIWVRSECDVDDVRNLDSDKVILDSSDTDTAVDKEPVEDKSPSKSKKKKKRNRMTQFLRDMKKRDADDAAQTSPGSEILDIYRNLAGGPPCVLPGSDGAAFSDDIQALIQPEDIVVVKGNFSAFKGTDLLVRLRMKIITELYLVGCMTNLSVFATAQDAASHGLILNIVEDCMGFRTLKRHEVAMKTMIEHMGAYATTSPAILAAFEDSLDEDGGIRTPPQQQDTKETDDLSVALSGLGLGSNAIEPDQSVTDLAEALASSSLNRRSLNSPQPKSASRPPTANPSNEAQSPLSAKNLRSSKSTPDIRNRSNVRVRMRKRNEAEVPQLPQLPELPKGALHAKTLSREDEKTNMIRSILEAKQDKERNSTRTKNGEVTAHQPPLSNGGIREKVVSDIDPSASNLKGDNSHKNLSSATSSTKPVVKSKEATQSTKTSPSIPRNTTTTISIADTMKNPLKSFNKNFKNLSNLPSLGPDDVIGEGDSSIRYDLLGKELRDELDPDLRLSDTIFRAIYHEVQWQKMFHLAGEVPRLVAVQGAVDEDGAKPVYRHPSDQSPPLLPFTKHVDTVRKEAEKVVGHPLNHVLIQLYRNGQDYISEHSDKTLDIKKGSSIVNASFGAQRTMRLRTKRSAKQSPAEDASSAETSTKAKSEGSSVGVERTTQRIHMPHNSLFVLGLETNRLWLHGINQDKRAERDRASEELANNGQRISLTFRLIDTFLSADEQYIWGQGARNKNKVDAGKCVNADEVEAEKMIDAFGFENREGLGFDWDKVYGNGFDVLNMKEVAVNADAVDAAERSTTDKTALAK